MRMFAHPGSCGGERVWSEAGGVMATAILHLWWEVGEGGAEVHLGKLGNFWRCNVRWRASASVFLWQQLWWQRSWGCRGAGRS